jgi:hypothetical protein
VKRSISQVPYAPSGSNRNSRRRRRKRRRRRRRRGRRRRRRGRRRRRRIVSRDVRPLTLEHRYQSLTACCVRISIHCPVCDILVTVLS